MEQFKVGDRVMIGPKKWQKSVYSGVHPVGCNCVGVILSVDFNRQLSYEVSIVGTDKVYRMHPKQFLGLAFEWGDKIEANEDGKNWVPAEFRGYKKLITPDTDFKYTSELANGNIWCTTFARLPRPEPTQSITDEDIDAIQPSRLLASLQRRYDE